MYVCVYIWMDAFVCLCVFVRAVFTNLLVTEKSIYIYIYINNFLSKFYKILENLNPIIDHKINLIRIIYKQLTRKPS